jgi:hypothetical protein
MKRHTLPYLLIPLLLLCCACTSDAPEETQRVTPEPENTAHLPLEAWTPRGEHSADILVEIEYPEYWTHDSAVLFIVANTGPQTLRRGNFYQLLYRQGEQWYIYPALDERNDADRWDEELPGGERYGLGVYYDWYENETLPPGRYAVAVDLLEADGGTIYTAIAEFTVTTERRLRKWQPKGYWDDQESYVTNPEAALLETEFPEYPPDAAEIKFTLTNQGAWRIFTGHRYDVIQEIGGEWFEYPYSLPFIEPLVVLPEGQQFLYTMPAGAFQFTPGKYAVAVAGTLQPAEDDESSAYFFSAIAEFVITD